MLSSQRQKNRLERLRQLERLGFSMPLEFSLLNSRPPEVEIEQCASELECPVVDLPDEQALFVVWVSLWAERPVVRLYDFRFEPPWRDHAFLRLPTFAESHIGDYYRLPGGLEYRRAEVLNLNFLKEGWRLPNTRVEGALCALSSTPIPEEYRHGAPIRVGLKFFGRSGHQIAATSVVLWADRWREPAVTRPSARPPIGVDIAEPCGATRPRRSSLYDGPPPEPTVSERSRAEYLRITSGERGGALSDRPSPSWQGLPIHGFEQAEPSREED